MGQHRIDLGSVWDQCIGLEFDTGGWVFHRLSPGYYEVHTLFLPKSRNVREKSRQAARYMFTATDCNELVTKVPADLPHALSLARSAGFAERFSRSGAWPRIDGPVGVAYLGLTLDEWVASSPEMVAEGGAFHEALGEHKDHGEDRVHDAYAGFGIACWKAGQPLKGLWHYNRWAVFAGYRPLEMNNGTVHFDGIQVSLQGGEIHVENASCL